MPKAMTFDELTKMMEQRAARETGDSCSAVIHFVPGTNRAKAKKWLEKCQKCGILGNFEVHQYDSRNGRPVWYIP